MLSIYYFLLPILILSRMIRFYINPIIANITKIAFGTSHFLDVLSICFYDSAFSIHNGASILPSMCLSLVLAFLNTSQRFIPQFLLYWILCILLSAFFLYSLLFSFSIFILIDFVIFVPLIRSKLIMSLLFSFYAFLVWLLLLLLLLKVFFLG